MYLKNNCFFDYKYHNYKLTKTNTNLAKCYGLPKVLNPTLSFRPIVSSIYSPIKFLSTILRKHLK